ncbi:MAG TPA: DNA cytosine methyltransferase [Planctomycetota bacterium]|nr:DNA cytosine methyltransferase [Planctomycetota bacterium]
MRLADWPAERRVWTGSCPCQPFSAAGRRGGIEDSRHLWPAFRWLIAQCRPATVFGEQVASADGREWLAGIRCDLEAMEYRVGAADLCAAGIGAPHIRQRLWWVADAESEHRRLQRGDSAGSDGGALRKEPGACSDDGGLADALPAGRCPRRAESGNRQTAGMRGSRGLVHADDPRWQGGGSADVQGEGEQQSAEPGFWAEFDLVHCTDGKARRIEPGSFPLADGVSNRVGRLRGYGNAIVPQVAAEFVRAFCETE